MQEFAVKTLLFWFFLFRILVSIAVEFGQILVQVMANILSYFYPS